MKKALCFILLLIIPILAAGCGKASSDDVSDNNSEIISETPITLCDKNGETEYRIVRAEKCGDKITSAASVLVAGMKRTLGVKIKSVFDTEDETECEILIGDTCRVESRIAKEHLINTLGGRYDDALVCTVGSKLCIVGATDDAVTNAVTRFCDETLAAKLPGGVICKYKTTGDFSDVTLLGKPIAYFKLIRQHYNISYITQLQTEAFTSKLAESSRYLLPYTDDACTPPGEYEILIGKTDRGYEEITDRDFYKITGKNGKVRILGGSDMATAVAVTEFTRALLSGDLKGNEINLTGSSEEALNTYDLKKYYTLTWYDDFDGEKIDDTKWTNGGGGLSEAINGKHWARTTDERYVYTANSLLTMQAHEDKECFYGGVLRSKGKMAYQYGLLETSQRIPDGNGFWTALYTDNAGIKGGLLGAEIDVNECFGNGRVINANMHMWPTANGKAAGLEHTSLDKDYSSQKRRTSLDDRSFNLDFHTFAYLWTPEKMSFICDGEIYFEHETNDSELAVDAFNKPVSLVLGYNIGSATNPSSTEPATKEQWEKSSAYITDYINIYQLKDGLSELYINY